LLARHWPNGNRHHAALALAGALIRSGWNAQAAEWFVYEVARTANDEEAIKRRDDVRSTASKLAKGEAATGGPTCSTIFGDPVWSRVNEWLELKSAPEWEEPISLSSGDLAPFPTDVFPEWLGRFDEAVAATTQTPPDLPGTLSLSAVSVANARKIRISVREGYFEPTNLYTAVALPPAERKSPVFRDVTRQIEDFEQSEAEALAPEIAVAESQFRILEARLKTAESKAAHAEEFDKRMALEDAAKNLAEQLRQTKIPVSPRLVADDCTPERLSMLLRDNAGRIAVLSPEGGVFDILAGRYSANGKPPNFEVYLKAHAGDTIRVDRVGRPPEFVQDPALTVGLAVQPEVLRGLASTPGFRGRGLLARFLYSVPPSRLGFRKTGMPPVSAEIRRSYDRNLLRLLQLPFARDPDGKPSAHILRFDPRALDSLQAWEAEIEPMLAPGGELGGISDWGGKLFGATVRIAGNLHMAEHAGDREPYAEPIRVETVERAIRLARYFITHAKAAFAEMGADPEVEGARYLLAWIERSNVGEFTKRDAYQATRGRFKRVSHLEPALALLVEHGFIRPKRGEVRPGAGRKPGPSYEVNPLSQKTQNTQNRPRRPNFEDSGDFEYGRGGADGVRLEGVAIDRLAAQGGEGKENPPKDDNPEIIG
jgi:hypothetical protein